MSLGWKRPVPEGWMEILWEAMAEDLGAMDPSAAIFEPDHMSEWYIEAQAEGVVCGAGLAFSLLQPEADDAESARTEVLVTDGDRVQRGTMILRGKAQTSRLLSKERTALNFLMLLSGTATLTAQFVEKLQGLETKVVDTRKTAPGLRALQKYAVRCGGGVNHRMGLYDGIMIKDNHIRAMGGIKPAVARAKELAGHMTMIEVECETPPQVEEAIQAGADIVMLDNMDPFTMQDVVKQHGRKVRLEASGGITLETVRGVAQTGVHAVSVGALTHSAPSLPFHLEIA